MMLRLLRSTRRQTLALVVKNFRLFVKFPTTTLVRALIFPILVTILFCLAKKLQDTNLLSSFIDSSGIATDARPINGLADAIGAASGQKLVFVRNGIPADDLDPIINGTMSQMGMSGIEHAVLNDPRELFRECRQTLHGLSNCFAAVVFTLYNATAVEYILAVDNGVGTADADYKSHTSIATARLMPLKWALDSQMGNFTTATRPAELPWQGYLASREYITAAAGSYHVNQQPNFWLVIISYFVSPVFMLTFMGIVYHLSLTVATERQSGISELLAAHTCPTTPRILSTLISFTLLYLPSWIICSVLFTRLLFTHCSDILFLFLSLLAGLSIASSTHFVASFFRKAQLSGLYTSILMFALAFVVIAFTVTDYPDLVSIEALCAIFPPIAYVTLVGDVVRAELQFTSFSLSGTDLSDQSNRYDQPYPSFAGYLYIVFFMLQIAVYTAATFGVEKWLWGVKRAFKAIDGQSDVALRCTSLSKTFNARSGSRVPAVNNLDLELKKGSVTFLLGPNGGGKTTTLKCIAGMTTMDKRSSLEINEDGLAFGVCPQGNVFWPRLTVLENIDIWRRIKTATLNDTGDDEDDVLIECDLLDKTRSPAKSLSGGQMRKLQLAIAFVGGSKICCIDEATSGLDPLSRRNIWNIITKGHARRSVLMTTHFLDEADVLADHIVIMYKGKMVCAGTATSLKATYGDRYLISEVHASTEEKGRTWQLDNSTDATRQLLELEGLSNNSYSVAFPTLEQVFLKVTESGNAIQGVAGDGSVNQASTGQHSEETMPEKFQHNTDYFDDGHSTSLLRQIAIILRKRYILLQRNWISFLIALATPIIVAGALSSVLHWLPSFVPCDDNFTAFTNGYYSSNSSLRGQSSKLDPLSVSQILPYGFSNSISAVVGPPSAFQGNTQDALYIFSTEQLFTRHSYTSHQGPLATRANVSSLDATIQKIKDTNGGVYFGIFAPTPENITILHQISSQTSPDTTLAALSVVTNRLANASTVAGTAKEVQTSYRMLTYPSAGADFRLLPLALLVLLAFITATAIAINYPTYERINNMRALQYCNGVSPLALWIAYWIFDMQILIVTALTTWGLIFSGAGARLWFAPGYILGAIVLFGWASYLGAYVLSQFVRRAAFAVAAGVHIILFVLYVLAYGLNQYVGSPASRSRIYDQLQDGMGIFSPVANLGRAFFIAAHNFDLACGETGYVVQNPFGYNLYGGVYLYFILQIVFLSGFLYLTEYGNMEWLHNLRSSYKGSANMPYMTTEKGSSNPTMKQNSSSSSHEQNADSDAVLDVSQVSKRFGRTTAVENVSFNISADETLALLGANGAGKTTMINMIRGLIKPNAGRILVEGVSVIDEARKARVHMGVCPQDDAIDELTVYQTLSFFAAIKGVKDVRGNVNKVMDALRIREFESLVVKKLSGGTRRKLMFAVALIGNPRVLLLDEPSTGLDAGAKRVLWKIMHSLSAGRAILLTTHSMEEVESLATKVTILGTRMLASGSLSSLRKTYGGFYRIRASYDTYFASNLEGLMTDTDAETLIADSFREKGIPLMNLVARYGQVSFEVLHEVRNLGGLMSVMEGLLDRGQERAPRDIEMESGTIRVGEGSRVGRGFKEYTIAEPTMEMIFMNVYGREGTQTAKDV